MKLFGWESRSIPQKQMVEQSFEADAQRKQLALKTSNQQRSEITIQYFPKDVDRDIVEAALRELGFRLFVGVTQVENVPTNAIWFGANVKIDDVKLVAYTLIRAGVEIKIIRLFRNPMGNRAHLIQVGADTAYKDKPALTVADIKNEQEFPR